MHPVHPLDFRFVTRIGDKAIVHMNPSNHEYTLVLLDFSDHITNQAWFVGLDPARLQRASEGTE